MSENTPNQNSEKKNSQDLTEKEKEKENEEKSNVPPKKDIMKEKFDELKSTYEQMIKLRKQNLESDKKFESSKYIYNLLI